MSETTVEELREIASELKLQTEPYIAVRHHDVTPELQAAVKDKEAFHKYLVDSQFNALLGISSNIVKDLPLSQVK